MTSVKIFVDHASQPSRAILVFCKINKIPHEVVETQILKRQHKTPEFAKINPAKKVPAILHGDYNLFQSHTILRYLAKQFNVPEQWYPRNDNRKASLIDQYLDWHHTNTRKCAPLFFWTRVGPNIGIQPPKSFNLEQSQNQVKNALQFISSYFLGNTAYILSDKPTIADLSAYEEITQLRLIDYDFSAYPRIQDWIKKMEEIPEVVQENVVFEKSVSGFMQKFPLSKK